MINSRKIEDLKPELQKLATDLILECKKQGIQIIITQTLRDIEYQNSLYDQGRTKAGNIVTNSKGGSSYHNYGLAFDVVPIKDGKADWNSSQWQQIGKIGQGLGLEWGGGFKTIKDMPHFQYTMGLTIADLKSGKTKCQP